jgi:ferric-dicitrate binding protein FerR (iron transport regulator)
MHDSTSTVEDLCKDTRFIQWVVAPTDESNRYWQAYLTEYPYKADDVQTAIDYVRTLRFREMEPSAQDLARLKQRIWNDIDQPARKPERQAGPIRVVQWYQRPYWAAAAVILVIVSASAGWWIYQTSTNGTYQTAYGKIQKIRLADGSLVTLNANSSLRVSDDMATAPSREVWLKGEAYFDIARRTGAKFIVHTLEANVEVLGTEFNVNTRREQTHVVLHEGNVQLSTATQATVVMKPGDMATVTPRSRSIQIKRVQPALYDAWKESYIILDGKTLPEIISTLEDTFGVSIQLTDKQLASKKLTGKLRTEVAEDCIENLSIILDAEVKKSGDTYRFE